MGYNADNDATLTDDAFLGDFYQNISLYVGPVGSPLNRVVLASFIPGSDDTSGPDIVATRVQYSGVPGELDHEGGGYWTIVQLDFTNLNLDFAAGTKVQFGMHTDQGVVGGDYAFSHASNAGLSGSPQEGADNLFRQFQLDADPATASFVATQDSNQGSNETMWDKSSDINVQVFATLLTPEVQIDLLISAVGGLNSRLADQLVVQLGHTVCRINWYIKLPTETMSISEPRNTCQTPTTVGYCRFTSSGSIIPE